MDSEVMVGNYFARFGNREKVILATKGGNVLPNGERGIDNSAANIRNHVLQSLEKLQTS